MLFQMMQVSVSEQFTVKVLGISGRAHGNEKLNQHKLIISKSWSSNCLMGSSTLLGINVILCRRKITKPWDQNMCQHVVLILFFFQIETPVRANISRQDLVKVI